MVIASGAFPADGYCTLAMPGIPPALLLLTAVPSGVWFPYLAALAILIVGLSALRKDFRQNQGLSKLVLLGPLFIAIPIAVFGAQHFTATQFIARMVPAWIPGHMFWTLLVGVCLIAAALSLAARKYSWLSSALLGVMILLFVCLISVPAIAGSPRNRILWAVGLRDLAFSAGAFSLAASYQEAWRQKDRQRVLIVTRFLIAVAIIFFGAEQVLHPEFAPGVPLEKSTPPWFPAPLLWGYATGAVFVVAGISLMINKLARLAATWLGLVVLLLVCLFYVPIVVANPADIATAFNYLVDTLMLSGSLLVLAGALSES